MPPNIPDYVWELFLQKNHCYRLLVSFLREPVSQRLEDTRKAIAKYYYLFHKYEVGRSKKIYIPQQIKDWQIILEYEFEHGYWRR